MAKATMTVDLLNMEAVKAMAMELAASRPIVEAAREWHQSRRFYALARLRYLELPDPELQARTPDQLLIVDAFADAEDLHNHNASVLAAAVSALTEENP